jgi:hypothetical protein
LDYEASLRVPEEVQESPVLEIKDTKEPLTFTTSSSENIKVHLEPTESTTEAAPKPEPEKSDPEPAAEESAPETPEKAEEIPDGKPATEAEMREAFIAENPGRKAIHGGYETKRYTAWKSQHGYE